MIKQDYLLRMINQLIEGMLRCLFKIKKDDNEEVIYKNSEDEENYKKYNVYGLAEPFLKMM
ncbi:DUF6483 family protein [Clostridium sp. HCP1S3_B4]|uniref:DUF6483 family protein n=1 Tax=unclassified Clostridium TaxID=2614128 RepID=UPI0016AB0CC7|nr:hypothetical protein [Clostridiales bacterium]